MSKLVALAALSFLSSCVTPHMQKLPMYQQCAAAPPTGETRYLRSDEVAPEQLPAMIPYAEISIRGASSVSECERAVEALSEKENPDMLYMGEPGSTYVGSVGGASASGGVAVAWSSPVYGYNMEAICYRLSPVRFGIESDADGNVLGVDDASRKSGIIEGDRIVSIAGGAIRYGRDFAKSGHYLKLLKMKPGDEVKLIWIRPGTGRMEGMLTCLPNPPIHLELLDARKEREEDMSNPRNRPKRSRSDF